MSNTLWTVKDKLQEYAVARLRLIKAEDDGIQGEIGEDEFYAVRDAEHDCWRELVAAIDQALQKA
jgi:hypothetical protein